VREPALLTLTYAVFGILAAITASLWGHDPWTTLPLLEISGPFAMGTSVVMGALLAGATIALSRVAVRRHAWARALHADLRPAVHGATGPAIVMMALASGVGEELVFRGLLVPHVGVLASSLAFGLLHQVRGRARWAWCAWATGMGAAFAAIFVLTGSLAGPVLAHVAINLVNLRYLRDHDPAVSAGETERPRASARGPAVPRARRA
jgi:membrane protease YdiL (CAAX protease family)